MNYRTRYSPPPNLRPIKGPTHERLRARVHSRLHQRSYQDIVPTSDPNQGRSVDMEEISNRANLPQSTSTSQLDNYYQSDTTQSDTYLNNITASQTEQLYDKPNNETRDLDAETITNRSTPDDHKPSNKGENKITQLKICSHNINGLKGSRGKMLRFMDWCEEQHMDVIGLSETNLTDKESAYLVPTDKDYVGIFSGKDTKIKGSGVALLLEERWAAHIGQKEILDHYLIHVTLMFKGCKISIIQLYFPPNDKEAQNKIIGFITKHITATESHKHHYTIIMGDYNSIVNSNMDREGNTRCNKRPSNLVLKLIKNRYIDSFRYVHPNTKSFTWSNNRNNSSQPAISTRIDHLWTSKNLEHDIIQADIVDMSLITNSDHATISALLDTSYIIRNHNKSTHRRMGNPRTKYKYDEMTPALWLKYEETLHNNIEDTDLQLHLNQTTHTQIDLNNIWTVLQNCIDDAANKAIPKDKAIVHNALSPAKQFDNRPRTKVQKARIIRGIINR